MRCGNQTATQSGTVRRSRHRYSSHRPGMCEREPGGDGLFRGSALASVQTVRHGPLWCRETRCSTVKRSPWLSARQRDADVCRMNRHVNPYTGSVCLFVVSSGGEQSDGEITAPQDCWDLRRQRETGMISWICGASKHSPWTSLNLVDAATDVARKQPDFEPSVLFTENERSH